MADGEQEGGVPHNYERTEHLAPPQVRWLTRFLRHRKTLIHMTVVVLHLEDLTATDANHCVISCCCYNLAPTGLPTSQRRQRPFKNRQRAADARILVVIPMLVFARSLPGEDVRWASGRLVHAGTAEQASQQLTAGLSRQLHVGQIPMAFGCAAIGRSANRVAHSTRKPRKVTE